MAAENGQKKYPMISAKHWWTLRDRFKSSIPRTAVTPSYLVAVLTADGGTMTEISARNNVITPLRRMGFIDDQGKLNEDLAAKWRSDEEYSTACQSIIEDVYPIELLDALPPPNPDPEAAKAWFMRTAGVGEAAAQRMAASYVLLCDANPNKRTNEATSQSSRTKVKSKSGTVKAATSTQASDQGQKREEAAAKKVVFGHIDPAINVNVQIHIAADSSADQIESIFAAMKKYLLTGNVDDDQR